MVWQYIAHSIQGSAHVSKGVPCQDRHVATILGYSPNEILVTCVADGAGSAKYSEEGASIACDEVLQGAIKHYEADHPFEHLGFDDILLWCETARLRFGELADQRACAIRQFATTLCVAILSPRHALFFQIGDGAIILGSQGAYGVVFWPQSGEYANSTNFLTADKFHDLLEFRKVDHTFSEVALLTDGLERVALQFHSQTPHSPFFKPLLGALQDKTPHAILADGLRQFLQSEELCLRSDDDKTLVLASQLSEAASP